MSHHHRNELDAELVEGLEQQSRNARNEAKRIEHEHVPDDRNGGLVKLYELRHLADRLARRIHSDQTAGNKRHTKLSRGAKYAAKAVMLIDLLLMFWFVSYVFNVDWDNPFGIALLASVGFTLITTAGAVFVLDKAGRVARDDKNPQRHVRWSELHGGVKVYLVLAGAIAFTLAMLIATRVFLEGVLSGDPTMAVLLAIPVGLILLAANAWVCWSAFLDSSQDRDDLDLYSRRMKPLLDRKDRHTRMADQLDQEIQLVRQRLARKTDHAARPGLVHLRSYRTSDPAALDAAPTVAGDDGDEGPTMALKPQPA